MENETNTTKPVQEENTTSYVIGAIIVIAVVVVGIIFWPKGKTVKESVTSPTVESKPQTGAQLTKLTCEKEWYNPVIGMPKFYLSATGGDVKNGTNVECTFLLIKDGKTVLEEKVTVPLSPAPDRNGSTFACTTKALENLPQNVTLGMSTIVKNDAGETASCSGSVNLH